MKYARPIMPSVFEALHKGARPYLTILVATLFNIAALWAWLRGDLPIRDYLTALGPTNSMIIGFWFGERAALKNPQTGSSTERREESR